MNFQNIVSQFFQWQTWWIVRMPLPFLLIPPLITVFVTSLAIMDFRLNVTNETLQVFLPDRMQSLDDLRELLRVFPPVDAQRDSYSLLGSRFVYTVFEDVGPERNALKAENIKNMALLHKTILNITTSSGVPFSSVCLRPDSSACTLHPFAFALEDSDPLLSTQFLMRYPQLTFADVIVDNAMIFGGVKTRKKTADRNGNAAIESAKAVRIVYVVDGSEEGERWMIEFLRLIPKLSFPNASIYWSSARSLPDEMERNGELLLPWMPWMISVLVLLCMLICSTRDSVRSQPWIGVFAMMNAVLATVTGTALLFAVRYPFLPLIAIMPFLVISIGTDNMFLMLKSWRIHEREGNLERRFVKAITDTSASILLTSLTDGLSFSIGSLSDFHAVRVFCTYCAMSILCMFFYQSTFFTAAMFICCRRETAGRHSLFLHRVNRKIENRPLPPLPSEWTIASVLGEFLPNIGVKLFVATLYCAYLAASTYFAFRLPLGLDLKLLTPDNSYVAKELAVQERLFNDYGTFCFAVVRTKNVSFADPLERRKLIGVYREIGSSRYASPYEFWLEKFDSEYADVRMNDVTFMKNIMRFMRTDGNEKFKSDVRFTHDGKISEVKMLFRLRNLSPLNDGPRSAIMRGILRNSSYRGFVYDTSFLLVDQQSATVQNVVVNVVTATAVMLGICFLLVPRLVSSLCIAVSIVSINIGVVGALSLVHTRLDIISMITIVMSIGFSVDYVAHTTFHFLIHREERLKHCLLVMTSPILQSAISTVVGVSLLSPVPSYIIRTFVYTVVFVVAIGVLHGLIFLPVLLDTVVPKAEYLEPFNDQPTRTNISHISRGIASLAVSSRISCYRGNETFTIHYPTDNQLYCVPPLVDCPSSPSSIKTQTTSQSDQTTEVIGDSLSEECRQEEETDDVASEILDLR